MADHQGKTYNARPRDDYDSATHDEGRHARDDGWSSGDPINLVVCVLLAIVFVMLRSKSGEKKPTFDKDEMAAYEKAEQVRKDLEAVQKTVAPKPAAPYLSMTVNKSKD